MSSFACEVLQIDNVEDCPNADRLSVLTIKGYQCISNKLPDGSPRYKTGDWVVYIPEASLIPEWLLKKLGFWDESENRGTLSGSAGNRVKPKRLRGVLSEGVVYPVVKDNDNLYISIPTNIQDEVVFAGQDVSTLLGITKYDPEIPVSMRGQMGSMYGFTKSYDIDNYKNHTNLFQEGEEVVVTTKLHGCIHENTQIMLPNGEYRNINEIIENAKIDTVLSYNIEQNQYISRKITGKMKRANSENKRWIKLNFENGQNLILTEDHPVYSRYRNTWIKASEILDNEDIESPIA